MQNSPQVEDPEQHMIERMIQFIVQQHILFLFLYFPNFLMAKRGRKRQKKVKNIIVPSMKREILRTESKFNVE